MSTRQYEKVGDGRILRWYKKRIAKVYPVREDQNLYCLCGNQIGIDEGHWYKMKQNAFEYSGRITKK